MTETDLASARARLEAVAARERRDAKAEALCDRVVTRRAFADLKRAVALSRAANAVVSCVDTFCRQTLLARYLRRWRLKSKR